MPGTGKVRLKSRSDSCQLGSELAALRLRWTIGYGQISFVFMSRETRTIEIDVKTAELLERRAAEEGVSVAQFLADAVADGEWPVDLEAMCATGIGPWSPEALAEDEREIAEFDRTGIGVPWEEIYAWLKSRGTPNELPMPKPRKL